MFLEISQNSQENTCARVFFLIFRPEACDFIEKEFCEISKSTFLHRTPLMAASVLLKVQYGSSRFLIFWKALPIDCRPNGKRVRTYTTYWYKTKKTGVDIFINIEKLLQKEVSVLKTKFCKRSKLNQKELLISGLRKTSGLYC